MLKESSASNKQNLRFQQPHPTPNPPKTRLSFNSLSKSKHDKTAHNTANTSKDGRASPIINILSFQPQDQQNINPNCQYGRVETNQTFRNVRLFSKIADGQSRANRGVVMGGRACARSGYAEQYGIHAVGKAKLKQQRPQSQKKIKKYFPNTPKLIRPKSNSKSENNLLLQPQIQTLNIHSNISSNIDSEYFTWPTCQDSQQKQTSTFTIRKADGLQYVGSAAVEDSMALEVNTSLRSVKFDMSPFFL